MEEDWTLDHDPRVTVKDLFLRQCLRIIPNQALDQGAAVEEEWTLDHDPRAAVKDLFLRQCLSDHDLSPHIILKDPRDL